MDSAVEIIRQYKQTGLGERMFMFLQYRDLRDIFQEVEFNESEELEPYASSAEEQNQKKPTWFLSLFKGNQKIKAAKEGKNKLPELPEMVEGAPLGRPSC